MGNIILSSRVYVCVFVLISMTSSHSDDAELSFFDRFTYISHVSPKINMHIIQKWN